MTTVSERLDWLDRLYPDLPTEIRQAATVYWADTPTGTVTVDRSCVPDGRPRWTIEFNPPFEEMRWS